MARAVEADLHALPGIRSAESNLATGSLVVRYDPGSIGPEALIEHLRDGGYPIAVTPPAGLAVRAPSIPARLARRAGKAAFAYLLETAVERSVPLVIAALL